MPLQTVGRRPSRSKTGSKSQAKPYRICGGQSGNGAGLSPDYFGFPFLMFHHCPLHNHSSVIKAIQYGQLTAWLNNTLKNADTDCETLMHEVILPSVLKFSSDTYNSNKKRMFCVHWYTKFQQKNLTK
jgi:hypothetical protein